ncbi:hypothetical protein TL16_g05376 [Triparma laevis f. inornata]|uniref:Uncharacterized protein n=2 Tax=Triparma laevis TaxID=1534972 RepID=A0A9W7CK65_9STRA|nr:hypothetical protein TL16_g05376 [Triparma laevis f. inornata]GMI07200.1 hypothetical protein TrLO_g11049 [Triparma laevis f. longispina]
MSVWAASSPRSSSLTSSSPLASPLLSPLLTPPLPPPLPRPSYDDPRWTQLKDAEIKCIEYMCTEISLKHKRRKFLNILTSINLELNPGEGRIRSSSEEKYDEMHHKLSFEIPEILKSLRQNIEQTETIISSIRTSLNLSSEEGVWGRISLKNSSGDRTSSSTRERRSTWHGDSTSSNHSSFIFKPSENSPSNLSEDTFEDIGIGRKLTGLGEKMDGIVKEVFGRSSSGSSGDGRSRRSHTVGGEGRDSRE